VSGLGEFRNWFFYDLRPDSSDLLCCAREPNTYTPANGHRHRRSRESGNFSGREAEGRRFYYFRNHCARLASVASSRSLASGKGGSAGSDRAFRRAEMRTCSGFAFPMARFAKRRLCLAEHRARARSTESKSVSLSTPAEHCLAASWNRLRKAGAALASVHPLMTFVAGSHPSLAGVPFAWKEIARQQDWRGESCAS
jgi:hypothetical protein